MTQPKKLPRWIAVLSSDGWSAWFKCSDHYRDGDGWTTFMAGGQVVREIRTEKLFATTVVLSDQEPEIHPRLPKATPEHQPTTGQKAL